VQLGLGVDHWSMATWTVRKCRMATSRSLSAKPLTGNDNVLHCRHLKKPLTDSTELLTVPSYGFPLNALPGTKAQHSQSIRCYPCVTLIRDVGAKPLMLLGLARDSYAGAAP
jgi:hypothetical protein